MSKKSEKPQSRRHVMIFDEDWDFLMQMFGNQSARAGVGPGKVIQKLVEKQVARMRQAVVDEKDQSVVTQKLAGVIKGEDRPNV